MVSFLDAWLPLFATTVAVFCYRLSVDFRLPEAIITALACELMVLISWAVYGMGVYPTYLSRFRHLPTPSVRLPNSSGSYKLGKTNLRQKRTWMLGNRSSFLPDYPSQDVRDAVENVKNDGLIRFYDTLSREVLVVTTPEALRGMLTLKPYEFGHPGFVKYLMARLTGSKFNFLTPHGHRVRISSNKRRENGLY